MTIMLTLENETNYKDVVVNIDEFVPFDITFWKGERTVFVLERRQW